MNLAERVSRISNKVYDRMRHRAAFDLREEDAAEGDFEAFRGRKYAVLVTFRRNGEAMPSPVWFGLDDEGRAYVHTLHDAGKVKRIRADRRALFVASTTRGKPIDTPILAVARELAKDEWPHAEAALEAAYGTGRKVYQRAFGGMSDIGTYIEVSPRPAARSA